MMQPGMPTGYQGSNPNNVVHPFVQQGKKDCKHLMQY